MAHSQESTASSGYESSQTSATTTTTELNPHYLCYWLDTCKGRHELNKCKHWVDELHGKLGIYYSPSHDYKSFERDPISGRNLQYNRSGCTTVHLLVYNNDEQKLLFELTEQEENRQKPSLLVFPSTKPRQRNEDLSQIPFRAFQWLTTDTDFAEQCIQQGLKHRFLFQNANVIYPVHVSSEQASELTRKFKSGKELESLHWFSLSEILSQLPPWPNYIEKEATENELAQIRQIKHLGIKLQGNELWHVIATSLICIREHIPGGFKTFLKD